MSYELKKKWPLDHGKETLVKGIARGYPSKGCAENN